MASNSKSWNTKVVTSGAGSSPDTEEIEYIEKIVEVPEVIIQEKVRHVPKVEVQECVIEVPKIVYKEKIVEVPEIEYREVPVERVVEVPEVREEIVIKEVPVPQYVEKPVPEYVTVEVPHNIERVVPVPVEQETTYEFIMPTLQPKYKVVKVPVYVPRFIEVPIPAELLDEDVIGEAEHLSSQVQLLVEQDAPSLGEMEKLAEYAKVTDFQSRMRPENVLDAITKAFVRANLNTQTHTTAAI